MIFFRRKKKTAPVYNSEELMDLTQFWQLIETSKMASEHNYDLQQLHLKKALRKLNPQAIIAFDNQFRKLRGECCHWDFWAAAYIINGGCSDDTFIDFRSWLIGQGQRYYEDAVKNIDSLVQLMETNDGDWEGLQYIAMEVFEAKTQDKLPLGYPENTEVLGEEWEEEKLPQKYPILWNHFA